MAAPSDNWSTARPVIRGEIAIYLDIPPLFCWPMPSFEAPPWAEGLLQRMLYKIDRLCADRDRLKASKLPAVPGRACARFQIVLNQAARLASACSSCATPE